MLDSNLYYQVSTHHRKGVISKQLFTEVKASANTLPHQWNVIGTLINIQLLESYIYRKVMIDVMHLYARLNATSNLSYQYIHADYKCFFKITESLSIPYFN